MTTYTKLKPHQLESLGYSRTSERYLTSSGEVISKRQYQKAKGTGQYNVTTPKSKAYSDLGKKGAKTRELYKQFPYKKTRTLVNKIKRKSSLDWGGEKAQEWFHELFENTPKELHAELRRLIYQKKKG